VEKDAGALGLQAPLPFEISEPGYEKPGSISHLHHLFLRKLTNNFT
jgi:hypothetical protein